MSQAQQGKATNVLISDNGSLLTCNGCGYSSQHRYLYERHVKRCVALAAGETFDASSAAPRGRTPQLVHRNYRCKQCNFTTTKSKLFLAHRRAVHGDIIKVYPCDICEYASKYKSKLLRHRNLKHKGVGDYSEENAGYMSEEAAEDLLQNASNQLHIAIGSGDGGVAHSTLTIAFNNALGERVLSGNSEGFRTIGHIQIKQEPEAFQENSSQDEESQGEESYQQTDALNSQDEALLVEDGPADNAFNFISEATTSTGRPLSQCTLCNYSNPHKWKVANHVRSFHMKKKLFKCTECEFVTGRKIEFCVHKAKTHATSKVYSCDECSYCTISRTNYERHVNNHVGGGPIKCTYCSYSSTGEAAVIRHMQEYHPKQQVTPPALRKPPQLQPRTAPPAPASSPTRSLFAADGDRPYSISDSGVANFTASAQWPKNPTKVNVEMEANKFTPAKKNIGSDILSFAKKAAGRSGNEVDCPVCGITFRTEARLRIHMVSHSDEASHHCPLCSLKYKRTSDLNRHMKKKHNSKLRDFFYMGMQEQPLNLSYRAEAAVPSNRFSQVQPTFSDEDQPLDLSTKPKPQVIQVPNVTTNKVYRGPYSPEELKCTRCSYLAKWPSDLKRHALVHSMEKRYKCEYCQRRYKYQFDLNMHLRRSHHVSTGRPRVSNVVPNQASPPLSVGMSLPTQVALSPSPDPSVSLNSPSASPPTKASLSEGGPSSPLASLRPFIPTPSPPPPPIQVSVPMEVVFAPSSVHDMENTLPPSMQRMVDPVPPSVLTEDFTEKSKPPVEQYLPPSKQEQPDTPSARESDSGENLKTDSIAAAVLRRKGPPPPAEQAISGVEHRPPRVLKMKAMKPQRLSSLTAARKFKCNYCPYLGLYQSEVDRHTRLHTGEKPYKCVYCVYRSAWKGDMKRHIIKHHAAETSAAASLESILEYCRSPPREGDDGNIENTNEEKNIENASKEKCAVEYAECAEDAVEVESTTEEMPNFICSDEDEENEATIERVVNSNHKEDSDVEAAEKVKELDLSMGGPMRGQKDLDYNGNKQLCEAENEAASEMKVQHCPHCPFICEDSSKMKWHIETHGNLKRFKCAHCGKRSNWFWDVRKHIKKAHPGKAMTVVTLSEKDAISGLRADRNSPLAQNESNLNSRTSSVEKEESCGNESTASTDENTDVEDNAMIDPDVEDEETVEEPHNESVDNEENNNTMKIPAGSSRGKKYRPYKCSACPRRSNWRWDIMKHIRKIHPSAKMITLSEEVAKATFSESVMKRPKGQGLKAQRKMEKLDREKEPKKEFQNKSIETKFDENFKFASKNKTKVVIESDKNCSDGLESNNIPFKKRKLEAEEEKTEQNLKLSPRKKPTIPSAFNMESIPKPPKKAKVETIRCKGSKDSTKTKPHIPGAQTPQETSVKNGSGEKPILRCLKRYKCFYCPYRSNYRSDIGRHGKRLHRKQQLKVVILDEEEAASTLQDYRQKYAKKKFVLAANDSEERTRRKSRQTEKRTQPKNSDRPVQANWMSESAQLLKSSVLSKPRFGGNVSNITKMSSKSSRILLDQSNVLSRCCRSDAIGTN